jgi:hypothetical protein
MDIEQTVVQMSAFFLLFDASFQVALEKRAGRLYRFLIFFLKRKKKRIYVLSARFFRATLNLMVLKGKNKGKTVTF